MQGRSHVWHLSKALLRPPGQECPSWEVWGLQEKFQIVGKVQKKNFFLRLSRYLHFSCHKWPPNLFRKKINVYLWNHVVYPENFCRAYQHLFIGTLDNYSLPGSECRSQGSTAQGLSMDALEKERGCLWGHNNHYFIIIIILFVILLLLIIVITPASALWISGVLKGDVRAQNRTIF